MNIEISNILSTQFPLLFEPQLRQLIAKEGTLVNVNQGDCIIDLGQYIKSVPLLISGSVKVVREDDDMNEILLYYIEAGETCAMSLTCCMADAQSEIRAVAVEDSTLIRIPVQFTDTWMEQFPSWKNFVMRSYRFRFEELLATIDSIAFMKMDERLEHYLMNRAEKLGSTTITGTHNEIAQDLNSSREVVSRLLKQLEKLGKVRLSRNKIELL